MPDVVTREEYEGLFNAIVRLTDRIEALEKRLLDSPIDQETGITAKQNADMGWPMTGDPEPYDERPDR